jgi:uncharacterized membrane protein YoaK (UPF0700 family)
MFSGRSNLDHFSTRNLMIWSALAFQAGAINAGGFLSCHRFVSHITGFATHFGTELGSQHWLASLGMLTVPLFFLTGAMISAFLVDRNLHNNKPARYPTSFSIIAICMLVVVVCGTQGIFGTFGEPLSLEADYSLLALLCLASGLQNATVTSVSGAVVRTTHLTGLATDLGIGLVRVFFPAKKVQPSEELRRNQMRISILTSFALGSALSTVVFLQVQYWGFVLPALISLALMVVSMRSYKNG